MPKIAVSVKDVSKVYGDKKGDSKLALDNISLEIPRGCIFGLLGPNGAGKSTLINILAGLVIKTKGKVKVWDIDIDKSPRNARAAMGVVPQEINLDPFFTPRKVLDIQAGLYGVPNSQRRTDAIIKQLGLVEKADAYSRTLSGGMQRRVMVAKALVHTPPILVLDEPTAGVDVELRRQLWDYVRELHELGVTILLTTHYLEEAEQLCDRVAIINHGRLIVEDETKALKKILDSKTLTATLSKEIKNLAGINKQLAKLGQGVEAISNEPNILTVKFRPTKISTGALLVKLAELGLEINELSTQEADLEDVFVSLTSDKSA